jgi:hypothetical protein
MSNLAHCEVRLDAEQPETRRPVLQVVEGGTARLHPEATERRMRRERRRAREAFRASRGWRIGTW